MQLAVIALEDRGLKETAVEIRDGSELPGGECPLHDRRVQAAEEERKKNAREELAAPAGLVLEAVDQEPPLAVQPSLLLYERQKEETRKDQQRLGIDRVGVFVGERLGEGSGDVPHGRPEALEELAGDALAVERAVVDPRQRRLV